MNGLRSISRCFLLFDGEESSREEEQCAYAPAISFLASCSCAPFLKHPQIKKQYILLDHFMVPVIHVNGPKLISKPPWTGDLSLLLLVCPYTRTILPMYGGLNLAVFRKIPLLELYLFYSEDYPYIHESERMSIYPISWLSIHLLRFMPGWEWR